MTTLPERITSKFTIGETGCWLWTASLTEKGYPRVSFGGGARRAHRVVYELLVGPIPAGFELDHTCRIRRCVNPAHLEPVTHLDNLYRSEDTLTSRNAAKTHCPKGHEYDGRHYRKDGSRYCGPCASAAAVIGNRRRRAIRKASLG